MVEYRMGADGLPDQGAAPRDILRIHKTEEHHNGGDMAFGPDGYLYISVGDGGSQVTAAGVSQDVSTLLGKILRIDPLHPVNGLPYTVPPPDNPFTADTQARPEIWALGMRNPWRFSFDEPTGDLWIADVGESQQEEIDRLPAANGGAGRGANLGWSFREGTAVFTPGGAGRSFVEPTLSYPHSSRRCAVIGGVVYRGAAIPALDGAYLYGDFCSGEVSAIRMRDGVASTPIVLATVPGQTVAAVEPGPGGEVYALGSSGGLFRLDPATSAPSSTVPDQGPPTTTAATIPRPRDPASIDSICGITDDIMSFSALPQLPASEARLASDDLRLRIARYREVAPEEIGPALERIDGIMQAIEAEVSDAGFDSPRFQEITSQITRRTGLYGDFLGQLDEVRRVEAERC